MKMQNNNCASIEDNNNPSPVLFHSYHCWKRSRSRINGIVILIPYLIISSGRNTGLFTDAFIPTSSKAATSHSRCVLPNIQILASRLSFPKPKNILGKSLSSSPSTTAPLIPLFEANETNCEVFLQGNSNDIIALAPFDDTLLSSGEIEPKLVELKEDSFAVEQSSAVKESSPVERSSSEPSFSTIFVFVLTTVLIWLSEPLLSLVDTTIVGQTAISPIIDLAALGPGTMLIDSSIYLTYFLAIATTNKLAKAIAKNDTEAQQLETSHALGVGAILGTVIMAITIFLGRNILTWVVTGGKAFSSVSPAIDTTTAQVVSLAYDYCKIRAVTAPLAVMSAIAQCAALVHLDIKTAFVGVIAASIVNLVGDVGLCIFPFKLGVTGAAVATSAATVASSFILLSAAKRRMKSIAETNPVPLKPIPFISLPDKRAFFNLVKLSGPIFFTIVAKLVIYSIMTIRSADFGLVSLACHNILLRFFFFFTSFGDSLSQTTQTFLPKAIFESSSDTLDGVVLNRQEKQSKPLFQRLRATVSSIIHPSTPVLRLLNRLTSIAACFSVINSQISRYILQSHSTIFTPDAAISNLLYQNSKWVQYALIFYPFLLIFEGCIISQSDLMFLVASYVVCMALLFGQIASTSTFSGVWSALLTFQIARTVQFGWRVWRKNVRQYATSEER